jgi:hypothetical protein
MIARLPRPPMPGGSRRAGRADDVDDLQQGRGVDARIAGAASGHGHAGRRRTGGAWPDDA